MSTIDVSAASADWDSVVAELEELCAAWRALADGDEVEVVDLPAIPTQAPPDHLEQRLRELVDEFGRIQSDLAIALDDTRTSLLDLRAASAAADRYLQN